MDDDSTPVAALPVAFRFTVHVDTFDRSDDGMAFREVGGLETEMEVETIADCAGGVYLLPKGWKHPRLTLSRGIARKDTPLAAWCQDTLQNGLNNPIQPHDVEVNLLDAEGQPLCTWSLTRAYPVKWTIDPFGATKNDVALERIELVYSELKRVM